ncbi:unnamed protein product [Arabis nemorensis]|uniref:Uncharacterized protein n=1 Tax=Arabis nemorensis TaxID=586526 RepID=A0A565BTT5_9BRAS|nr:unnamed protein product [Arabis nemorensis]
MFLSFINWSMDRISHSLVRLRDGGRKRTSRETVADDVKKVLSSIDAEGCFLHEVLERMLDGNSQRSKLSNLVLKQFRIQIHHGINVQVCFPGTSDLVCVLVRSDSENSGNHGLVRSPFEPLVVLITLHNLQFVDLIVRIPELSFSFRPSDLPVYMGLAKLSSDDSTSNLVSTVILWLRYMNAYEYLPSLAR